jgi:hypothetical protein
MKAGDILKQNKPPKILIFGPPGSGKTALVSQLTNAYMFDLDNGMRTAATLKDKFYDLRQKIEFETFNDQDPKNPKAWMAVKNSIISLSSQIHSGKWNYDAIVVDSLTYLAEAALLQVMFQSGKAMMKPEIQHWGMAVSEVENILVVLRSLPCMVVLTAHDQPMYLDDDTMQIRVSCIGQKLPYKLPAMFDEVWYAKTKAGLQGKSLYTITGKSFGSVVGPRTRAGMNKEVVHGTDPSQESDIGFIGLLDMIGYKYTIK